tara:strand:+ start:2696 stop:3127 length:432 start_codon:yes stop_codon:yes gene_type:complete
MQIEPLTIEAALEVASNLLPDDRREVEEGHGIHPIDFAYMAAQEASSISFTAPNGKTAGMGGIQNNGIIWMLCTPIIHQYPIAFIKAAKSYLDGRKVATVHNIVDARNTVHLKLLKFLGFKFLGRITHGPNNLTFIKFTNGIS